MLCFQCGTKVGGDASKCPNCGVSLKTEKKLELSSSRGLRISQEMKAIRVDQQIFPPGEKIDDRYKLAEMIGKGPFGEVYRAYDEVISADIAIKLFRKELITTPPDQDYFLRNMEPARKQTQENLVRIHGSGVHKDHPWVALQLLEGLSLRKVISLRTKKNEKFQTHELDAILSQIQASVDASGDKGHGDLKPENIIFLPDTLKVSDAFLSKIFQPTAFAQALKDSDYLAPEIKKKKAQGTAADVYSLGVIINEMLLGPDYRSGKILPTRSSAKVDELIAKATQKDPKKRFENIAALRDALEKAISTGGSKGATPPPPPSGVAMVNILSDDLPIFDTQVLPDSVVEAETEEFTREKEKELQNYIATTEVKRKGGKVAPPSPPAESNEPPLNAEKSDAKKEESAKNAKVPVGKAQKEESGFPFIWIGLAIATLVVVYFVTRSDTPVELGNTAHVVKEKVEKTPEKIAVVKKTEEKIETEKAPEKTEETEIEKEIADAKLENTDLKEKEKDLQMKDDSISSMLKDAKKDLVEEKKKDPQKAEKDSIIDPKTIGSKGTKVEEVDLPPGTKCPKGLRLKKRKWGNYCIATHEYPGRGAKPKTRVSWFSAKKMCAARGQRLCKKKEWRSACGSKYPYGKTFDANKCNSVDEDGFDRSIARAGSFKSCKKGGVYDLVGNVHEWTEEQKIVGGGFESDESVASCRYSSSKSPGSSAGYIGFRCCADPE